MAESKSKHKKLPPPPRALAKLLKAQFEAARETAHVKRQEFLVQAEVYRNGSPSQRALRRALIELAGTTERRLAGEQAALAKRLDQALSKVAKAGEAQVKRLGKRRRADMKRMAKAMPREAADAKAAE